METYPQTRWNLSALLEAPTGEPVDRALNEIESRTAHFEAAREKLQTLFSDEHIGSYARLQPEAEVVASFGLA